MFMSQRRVNSLSALLAPGPHFREEANHFFSAACECSLAGRCSNCIAENKPGRFLIGSLCEVMGEVGGWVTDQPEDRSGLSMLLIPADGRRKKILCHFQLDAMKRLAWACPQETRIRMRAKGLTGNNLGDFMESGKRIPLRDIPVEIKDSFRFDLTDSSPPVADAKIITATSFLKEGRRA
jgi:hypothetical protein